RLQHFTRARAPWLDDPRKPRQFPDGWPPGSIRLGTDNEYQGLRSRDLCRYVLGKNQLRLSRNDGHVELVLPHHFDQLMMPVRLDTEHDLRKADRDFVEATDEFVIRQNIPHTHAKLALRLLCLRRNCPQTRALLADVRP